MIFFCVLFLLKVFFLLLLFLNKTRVPTCAQGQIFFYTNSIKTLLPLFSYKLFDLYEDSCHLYADQILRIITLSIFYKHYPYVYDLSSIARKAMPLREGWLWNKTLCICYFYWCSINKFLGIFMTWYLRYTFHNQYHHAKHFWYDRVKS